jgi:hypothetical protein
MHSLRALGGACPTLSQHAHNASHAPQAWLLVRAIEHGWCVEGSGRPIHLHRQLLVAWQLQRNVDAEEVSSVPALADGIRAAGRADRVGHIQLRA